MTNLREVWSITTNSANRVGKKNFATFWKSRAHKRIPFSPSA